MDTSNANGTETYLLGISTLSEIGDLSSKYPRRFMVKVGEKENRLKKLILGNRKQGYYNPYWSIEPSIDLAGFDFLEEFNLENCESFNGSLDFRPCPRIKKIFLNGSSPYSLILPPSGVIEELRIPTSITNLSIDSHPELKSDKFTLGHFNYASNRNDEVNGEFVNDYSKLLSINVKNTPIDTYGMVK
jgi:hypothetical protein